MSKQFTQEELTERHQALLKLVKRASMTMRPLEADWKETIIQWQKDKNSQFWSRMAIRCLCAAIEARLFAFRKMAEQMAPLSNIQFEIGESETLAEERIVCQQGVPAKRPKFLPFPDAVKESFRLFAKAVGITADVDYGGVGYEALRKTFEVRNRLMHPKTPFDVEVNQMDIATADQGVLWFNVTYVKVIDSCQKKLNQDMQRERGMYESH
jgi:hypothetical protein